jgi:hypothetical protein
MWITATKPFLWVKNWAAAAIITPSSNSWNGKKTVKRNHPKSKTSVNHSDRPFAGLSGHALSNHAAIPNLYPS